ncbi:MAG: aminotransferase class I/II-fold pyridoxal phosphate-dependent enzyme, partial [Muribaculaceae bacterium]|nr:aminotransferase class I/II-fold pyridoxal phosphate-dependent enzyme [Muribaculaceae bacterium]
LPPPVEAIDAAVDCLHRKDSHGYQMTVGLPELRAAFAEWYGRIYGVRNLDPNTNILPLIGSKEGVLNIALAYVNPGDAVLVPNPGYPTYTSASRLAGADIISYDLCEERNWEPDFDALERLDLSRVKVMWVNYPHMPTGTPARAELFERLVDFGRRHSILIVNDNPYSLILNDSPLSILSVEGAMDTAIEMNSLSKCLNMAGWRVGMIAGAPEFISTILKVKSNIDSGQPRAMMEGAIAALGQGQAWYAALSDVYRRRQKVAALVMEAMGCTVRPGQQGLFLWGRIPDTYADAEALSDAVLDRARVFVTPGFIFGSQGKRYVRVSLCEPEDLIYQAYKRIEQCL